MTDVQPQEQATARARARYDRIARVYDLVEASMERRRVSGWRQRLWAQVRGPRILEVGTGTGKNLPFYPAGADITAVDFSPKMLERARQRAVREGIRVDLRLMDIQRLEFPDDSFDSVVATFVFCSVPDPVLGLQGLRRVVKPEGRIHLLEHVRPKGVGGRAADLLNPLVVRVMGANINRCTLENVERAGLSIERVDDLWRDIVKLIVALPRR